MEIFSTLAQTVIKCKDVHMLSNLIFCLTLAFAGKPSQFNTQVHEKEASESSFTAVVKILREVQGDSQVFFEGKSGTFTLDSGSPQFGSMQTLLVTSQKKKIPVSVTFNSDTLQILTVVRAQD